MPSSRHSQGLVVAAVLMLMWSMGLQAHDTAHNVIDRLSQELALDPDNPALLIKRGRIHAEARHWQLAIADYRKAQALAPEDPEPLYWLGVACQGMGNLVEARRHLERYLLSHPEASRAHEALARVHLAQGQTVQAVEHFDQAVQYSQVPQPQLYIERARAQMDWEGAPFEAVEAGLAQGLRTLGPVVSLYEVMVELALEAGHPERALHWMDRMPPVYLENPNWLLRRAGILRQLGRSKAARKAYRRVITAIEALPVHRRNTAALQSLLLQAREGLSQT